MKKILAFSGSNSSQSINQALIKVVANKVSEHEVTVLNLVDFPMPIYSIDQQANGIPETALALKQQIVEHDAMIIAMPEHNGLMPAFFKNVVDWLSRIEGGGKAFFGGEVKPVLLLSTSPGERGGLTGLTILEQLMPRWGTEVKGKYNLGNFQQKYNQGVFDEETDQTLSVLVKKFEANI